MDVQTASMIKSLRMIATLDDTTNSHMEESGTHTPRV